MTKKIIVLVGEKHESGKKFVDDIAKYSKNSYVLKKYSDVCVSIKDGELKAFFIDDNTGFDDADLVFLRGMTDSELRHVLAAYLFNRGIPVVNSESNKYQVMSKLEQNVVLALSGVPVPDCVFVSDEKHYEKAFSLLGVDFPIVAKSINGRNGNDNILVRSALELSNLDIPSPVFQPFIPNMFDYRVIVAGEQVILSYKRVRSVDTDDYRNNISQGGRREFVDLPDDLRMMAVRASKSLGREFCGLDILTNSETGESVVLEVNFNFGTPEIEGDASRLFYENVDDYFESLMK